MKMFMMTVTTKMTLEGKRGGDVVIVINGVLVNDDDDDDKDSDEGGGGGRGSLSLPLATAMCCSYK